MRIVAGCVCLMIPPGRFKNMLLRSLGWNVHPTCRIGFSWVSPRVVKAEEGVTIGHLNFIRADALVLGRNAFVGHLNLMKGPFWIVLRERAAIGNLNKLTRARRGVTWGRSLMKLGVLSKITSRHLVDCSRSVVMGDYSILAGSGSQIWTHGYMHAPQGPGRCRVDGRVRIGGNVYIGSACIINAGVRIADAITVGAASCVSRSLTQAGLYVSQPLRWVPYDYEDARARHPQVRAEGLVEEVFNKSLGSGR